VNLPHVRRRESKGVVKERGKETCSLEPLKNAHGSVRKE
jgi:hypothetical protein